MQCGNWHVILFNMTCLVVAASRGEETPRSLAQVRARTCTTPLFKYYNNYFCWRFLELAGVCLQARAAPAERHDVARGREHCVRVEPRNRLLDSHANDETAARNQPILSTRIVG